MSHNQKMYEISYFIVRNSRLRSYHIVFDSHCCAFTHQTGYAAHRSISIHYFNIFIPLGGKTEEQKQI